MRHAVVLAVGGVLLTSCERSTTAEAPSAGVGAAEPYSEALAAIARVKLDASTPERALKSIWALHDAGEKAHCTLEHRRSDPNQSGRDLETVSRNVGHYIQMSTLTTGNVRRYIDQLLNQECTPDQYARVINEVKQLTPSRASITATVKNTTPVPQGATANELLATERERGARYRYVFALVDGTWRLEDVFRIEDDGSERQVHADAGAAPYPWATEPF